MHVCTKAKGSHWVSSSVTIHLIPLRELTWKAPFVQAGYTMSFPDLSSHAHTTMIGCQRFNSGPDNCTANVLSPLSHLPSPTTLFFLRWDVPSHLTWSSPLHPDWSASPRDATVSDPPALSWTIDACVAVPCGSWGSKSSCHACAVTLHQLSHLSSLIDSDQSQKKILSQNGTKLWNRFQTKLQDSLTQTYVSYVILLRLTQHQL